MSLDTLHTRNGRFFNDEDTYGSSPSELGKFIVDALLRRRWSTDFGISPEGAVEMLRLTGRNGQFKMNKSMDEFPESKAMRLQAAAAGLAAQATSLPEFEDVEDVREQLLDLAYQLRVKAAQHNVLSAQSSKAKSGITLPKVKCADTKMGTNAIWFDAKTRTFNFGGFQLGTNKLGRLLALTLMRGEEWIQVADVRVTVDYIIDMCRIAGEHGSFGDFVDEGFEPLCPQVRRDPALHEVVVE